MRNVPPYCQMMVTNLSSKTQANQSHWPIILLCNSTSDDGDHNCAYAISVTVSFFSTRCQMICISEINSSYIWFLLVSWNWFSPVFENLVSSTTCKYHQIPKEMCIVNKGYNISVLGFSFEPSFQTHSLSRNTLSKSNILCMSRAVFHIVP